MDSVKFIGPANILLSVITLFIIIFGSNRWFDTIGSWLLFCLSIAMMKLGLYLCQTTTFSNECDKQYHHKLQKLAIIFIGLMSVNMFILYVWPIITGILHELTISNQFRCWLFPSSQYSLFIYVNKHETNNHAANTSKIKKLLKNYDQYFDTGEEYDTGSEFLYQYVPICAVVEIKKILAANQHDIQTTHKISKAKSATNFGGIDSYF